MRILLTSGGTKVPIDDVRSITNMSSGNFGAKIGRDILDRWDNLIFLTHKDGKTPIKTEVNLLDGGLDDIADKIYWAKSRQMSYKEITYNTFDDYYQQLGEQLLNSSNVIDAVVLAAAVSDYVVKNPTRGKVRTSAQMNIELEPTPKIISKIRNEWGYKGILVGFKLLVNAEKSELIDTARKSVIENGCDFVVANDLRDIKAGNHRAILVFKDTEYVVSKEEAVSEILYNIRKLYNNRMMSYAS